MNKCRRLARLRRKARRYAVQVGQLHQWYQRHAPELPVDDTAEGWDRIRNAVAAGKPVLTAHIFGEYQGFGVVSK
jgi:hypothetical protein